MCFHEFNLDLNLNLESPNGLAKCQKVIAICIQMKIVQVAQMSIMSGIWHL